MNITDEQYNEIELLSAKYTPENIAVHLCVDVDEFLKEWADKDSKVRKCYDNGVLKTQIKLDLQILSGATTGNVFSTTLYRKDLADKKFDDFKKQKLIERELEEIDKLQALINSGKTKNLPEHIIRNYERLDLVRSLHFKGHGKNYIVDSIRLSFQVTYETARQIYSDGINFFYCDNSIKKQAWCNYFAEKYEMVADFALELKNFETWDKLMDKAAKLRGCFTPEEKNIDPELLKKKITIYITDPLIKNMQVANRNDIAGYIDRLPDIPYANKQMLHRDAQTDKFEGTILEVDPKDIEYLNDEKN